MAEKILKGQNFRYGFYDVNPHERMDALKQAGFDEVMLWWGDEYNEVDGTPYDLYDYAQKLGLGVHTCHFPTTHADWLWYDGERGRQFVAQYVQACKECGERGISYLVTHTTKKLITPEPNQHGVDNFARMLEAATKYGVVITLENSRFLNYIDYLFDRYDSPNVGFCFDCGHANCFTPNEQPLERFGDKLVTTHLHDNVGPRTDVHPDLHRLIGDGNINCDNVFARLKHYGAKYYNLESKCTPQCLHYGRVSAQEYMHLSFERLTAQLKKSGIQ